MEARTAPLFVSMVVVLVVVSACVCTAVAAIGEVEEYWSSPASSGSEEDLCDAETGRCLSSSSSSRETAALDKNEDEDEEEDWVKRRVLASNGRVYISYSALSANRVPCPPRSGRSYYTPSCNRATGRANPYTRGCSRITRCQRASY